MGQKSTTLSVLYNRKDIKQSVQKVFEHSGMAFAQNKIVKPIKILIQEFQTLPPFTQTEEGFHISRLILHIFTCRNYQQCLLKLLKLLIDSIADILEIYSLFIVHPQAWKSIKNIVKFITILSDERMWSFLIRLNEIQNLDSETKQLVSRIRMNKFASLQPLIDKLFIGEVNKIEQSIMIILSNILQYRQGILSRSESTYLLVSQFEQISFVLYLKLYFSNEHHSTLKYQIMNSSSKYSKCLKLATYFLLIGIDKNKPSLYDLAVLYIQDFTEKKYHMVENSILPSHLFSRLPIFLGKQFYSYMIFHILCLLNTHKSTFNCNIIMSYKLILNLLNLSQEPHYLLKSILEGICLNTNQQSIQRAYLSKIVQIFLSKNQINKTSKILQSFLEISRACYHVKLPGMKEKLDIDVENIIQSLKNNNKIVKDYQQLYTEKFLYQQIFKKPLECQYSDSLHWKNITKYRQNVLNKQQTMKQYENLSTNYLTNSKTIDQSQHQY